MLLTKREGLMVRILDSYSGVGGFKFLPRERQSRKKVFVVFVIFRQIPKYYFKLIYDRFLLHMLHFVI